MKSLKNITLLFIILLINLSSNYAQRCGKKLLCDMELDKSYDYRSQSTYAELYPGDTIRTKTVVYSGQEYDVFLCGNPVLGAMEYSIIKQHRKTRKVIDKIEAHEEIKYQLDEYGDYVYDDYGDYIEIGRETVNDTTWVTEKYIDENIIFNSLNNDSGSTRWKYLANKTESLVIEVVVPDNASSGCADLFIGHRSKSKSSFKR